jgi:hypothetical protein
VMSVCLSVWAVRQAVLQSLPGAVLQSSPPALQPLGPVAPVMLSGHAVAPAMLPNDLPAGQAAPPPPKKKRKKSSL